MRLAFWRSSDEGASAQKTSMPVIPPEAHIARARAAKVPLGRETGFGDLDFRAIGSELWSKRQWIVAPTLMVAVLSILAVNMVTPISIRAAVTVVASVPILLVYPFMQKYFVVGLNVGSVKE